MQHGNNSISFDNTDQNIHTHMKNQNSIDNNNFTVTPWEVEGDIDYNKLIEKFGTFAINNEIIEKIEKITGEVHPFLKNRYFFSHRDLDWILDEYQKGNKFYLYTGRGPSGHVHLGHLMPWLFTKYLQDKFNVKLIFQITDDEKFLFNDNKDLETINKFTFENVLDIIAIGFDPVKTKIIIDTKHINYLYPLSIEIAKRITFSTAKAVFGFSNSSNIGMIGFPPIQSASVFSSFSNRKKINSCINSSSNRSGSFFKKKKKRTPKEGKKRKRT